MGKHIPLEKRFWPKVDKCGPTPADRPELGPCWTWTGSLTERGYGRVSVGSGVRFAHTIAYEFIVGAVPAGLELDHLCRQHACCNPAHLEAVTHAENVRRGMCPTSILHRANTCKRGHELTPGNVYVQTRADGRRSRACRTCGLVSARVRNRARYLRMKAARVAAQVSP